MADKFISFHNHTSSGSLLDALIRTDELFGRAKELGQEAIAVTDHGSVFSIYDAYKISKKTGVKLIPGNEFYFVHDPDDPEERGNKHLVLVARNETGWKNILRLNYVAWGRQKTIFMKQYPRITWADIEKYNEGIIALTACSSGVLSRHIMHDDLEAANRDTLRLKHIFGEHLFLEVQPHKLKTDNGKVDQLRVNHELFKMAKEHDVKLITTCDVHYLNAQDAQYHDMLLAIKDKKPISDPDRHRYSVNEFYLKGTKDIHAFFGIDQGQMLINNSQLINSLCEVPTYLEPKGARLPEFPVSDATDYKEFKTWAKQNVKTEIPEDAAYLRYKTAMGFQKAVEHIEPEKVDEYWQRLKTEVKILEDKKFSSYMLIVADYIDWAKKNGIVVGPARGSAAGSLVSNLIGITTVDPIKHKLLFARFINKFKKSFPDIDTDFSVPDRVKEYVKKKYGEKRVASISNVVYMTPKMVVKDVARSLELGGKAENSPETNKSIAFKIANDITKVMPDSDTVRDATIISKDFASFMGRYPELMKYCERLQNIERQNGVHAAGVIIANEDLDSIAPLRRDKDGTLVMAWEKERCEENGFIKMDFLGLETLVVIDDTLKLIAKRTGVKYTTEQFPFEGEVIIPVDDADVYKMISRGDVKCVFQLEASAVPVCKVVKPKTIDEIAIVTALIRPAVPQEQRKAYVERRAGRQKVQLVHPKMYECTKDTFGEVLFEEQLMTLAHDIAGWDLDKADSLRKITKLKEKGKELTEKTEIEFLNDSVAQGIEYEVAQEIWEHYIENFTGYGFNLAHAVAYSYISYYTAWLKHHYPTEFMCAMLNSKDKAEAQEYLSLCKEMGIKILPPDVNASGLQYTVVGDKQILTGMLAVKGAGDAAIQHITDHRPYVHFADFLLKITGTKGNRSPVTKTTIEGLAKAGCFDILGITRKTAVEKWDDIKTNVNNWSKRKLKKQELVDINEYVYEEDGFDPKQEWAKKDILKAEREILGYYLSGSHNDVYGNFFRGGPEIVALENVASYPSGHTIKVEAIIKAKSMERKLTKGKNNGRAFAKYMIEDVHGKTSELTLWPDFYEKFRNVLADGIPFRAICEVNEYMESKSLVLKQIEDLPGVITMGIQTGKLK